MNIRFKSAIFCAYPKHGPRFPSSNICSLTPHKHQCLSYIGEEHCLSRNWVINTFSNTGIWFLHMWIIRDRDESACLRVWNILSEFTFWVSFSFRNIDNLWMNPYEGDHNWSTSDSYFNQSPRGLVLHTYNISVSVYTYTGLYRVKNSDTYSIVLDSRRMDWLTL